ncbi:hypothetical protein DTO280E4_9137 [Paecilomyces variotii]|nr:hypothetical protein DTO021C3_8959 [Paecilomyces variotii]KAJ9349136.1 hypothetical protein DTO280E4_9137 [Paecilomyces variotii]
MKYTALRETKEEIGVVVSPEAVFPLVYRRTFKLKGLRMVYYTSVAQLGAKVPVTVSHEHIAWGFFDEEAVRNFGPFVKEKSRQVKHLVNSELYMTLFQDPTCRELATFLQDRLPVVYPLQRLDLLPKALNILFRLRNMNDKFLLHTWLFEATY